LGEDSDGVISPNVSVPNNAADEGIVGNAPVKERLAPFGNARMF
jgi:hypothetical protein